jgi:hypothetical protein
VTKRSKPVWAIAALLAVNAFLLVAQPGLALPRSLANYFFGPNLIRAEVLVKDAGVVHDYRLDRGVIRAKTPGSLTLRERDGQVVTISVAPNAEILFRGTTIQFGRLRVGMQALTVREGDTPAILVQVG